LEENGKDKLIFFGANKIETKIDESFIYEQ
jgi:hypothetical protein